MHKLVQSRLVLFVIIFVILQIFHASSVSAAESNYERALKRILGGEQDTMEASPEGFSGMPSESVEKIQDLEKSKDNAFGREDVSLELKKKLVGEAKINKDSALNEEGGRPYFVRGTDVPQGIRDFLNSQDGITGSESYENIVFTGNEYEVFYLIAQRNISHNYDLTIYRQGFDRDGNVLPSENSVLANVGNVKTRSELSFNVDLFEDGHMIVNWQEYRHIWKHMDRQGNISYDGKNIISEGSENISPARISGGLSLSNTSPLDYTPLRPFLSSFGDFDSSLQSGTIPLADRSSLTPSLIQESVGLHIDSEDVYATERYEELTENIKDTFADYGYIDLIAALVPEEDLKDLISSLEEKEDRTDAEESILDISKAVIEDSQYIDDETMHAFRDAVHLFLVAENMKDLLVGVDFQAITKALSDLATGQKSLYVAHISATESIYEELQGLLNINLDDKILPDRYLKLNLSPVAKRKIIIDITLRNLELKDKKDLTSNERKAIGVARNVLMPMQGIYKEELKKILQKFILSIKENLSDAKPASTKEQETGEFKALFHLGR